MDESRVDAVLDLIDNAVHGGGDAMRWAPRRAVLLDQIAEGLRPARPQPTPATYQEAVEAFSAHMRTVVVPQLQDVFAQLSRALAPAVEAMARMNAAIAEQLNERDARRSEIHTDYHRRAR